MRYIIHNTPSGPCVGRLDGQQFFPGVPFASDFARFRDSLAGDMGQARPAAEGWTPALPLFDGARCICLGLNYVEHAKEGGHSRPAYPAFFIRVDSSLAPAGADVPIPQVSSQLDWEAELLVFIGKGGRHIRREDALDHVFGYGIFNDISVRDYQRKGGQWTPGKNFDGTGIVGEQIVTPDELPEGCTGLRISTRLNGEVMQDADTADMIFPVDEAIALISDFMTLRPGDMIAMGTPSGVGHARTPPVWMKDGDEVTVEVERVGAATSTIRKS